MEKCLILIERLRKIEAKELLLTKLKRARWLYRQFSPRTKGEEGCVANYGRNTHSFPKENWARKRKRGRKNCELGKFSSSCWENFINSIREVKEEEEDKMNKILWNVLMSAKALLFGGKNAKNERERKFCLLKNFLVLGSFRWKLCE